MKQMKQEAIDPRRERLIAFIYGELSESESRAFQKELDADEALRLEFNELSGTRETLAGWRVPEPTPSFVFVDEPSRSRPRSRPTWWKTLFSRGSGPLGFGLGLATASALAFAFVVSDFRVERVDGGLAFRVGEPVRSASNVPARMPSLGAPSTGTPLELVSGNGPSAAKPDAILTGSDSTEYLTRAEFERLSGQMVGSIVDLLNEYSNYQNQEMGSVLQAMYERMSDRQSRESDDLRHRMSALGVELLLRQTRGNGRSAPGVATPASIEPREAPNLLRTMDWKEEWR